MSKFILTLVTTLGFFSTINAQNNFLIQTTFNNTEKGKAMAISRIATILQEIDSCKTSGCRAQKYHSLGSIYYFLTNNNTDTVEYYLQKSHEADSLWLCRMSRKLDSLYKDSPMGIYYANQFSAKWWNAHLLKCEKLCGNCPKPKANDEAEINQNKNIAYQERLVKMGSDDQIYRVKGDFERQAAYDLQNRKMLDSLYLIYGFPSNDIVSSSCQDIAWRVVHHSTDCKFVQKWIDKFLTAYQNKQIEAGFLDATIKRFFDKDSGFCKEDKETFVKHLKTTYPFEFQTIFGYKNY